MPDRRDCIDEILEAIGNRMKRSQVNDRLEDINDRAEAYEADGMNRAEALRRAAEEVMKEESIRNNIAKRNAREDTIKLRDLRNFVDSAVKAKHGAELAIEARLTGTNVPLFDPKWCSVTSTSSGPSAGRRPRPITCSPRCMAALSPATICR
jgi:hypothetical protein